LSSVIRLLNLEECEKQSSDDVETHNKKQWRSCWQLEKPNFQAFTVLGGREYTCVHAEGNSLSVSIGLSTVLIFTDSVLLRFDQASNVSNYWVVKEDKDGDMNNWRE
jgi:hypothetical protein